MNLIIHAPNVHQGGGKTLLLSLLSAAIKQATVTALLDKRLELPDKIHREINELRITPSLYGRFNGEWVLRKLADKSNLVLCFGNLPPLFKLKTKALLYIQNRYLVDEQNLKYFHIKIRLRIFVERMWLAMCLHHVQKILVQTPTMQKAVKNKFGMMAELTPFFERKFDREYYGHDGNHDKEMEYDFIYVATGEPHKNHRKLIDAWKLLASENIYPSLCLTLPKDRHPKLMDIINGSRDKYGLKIDNVSTNQKEDLFLLYKKSSALVYPSKLESFGLPLIEAKSIGLPVIASELDYVRDLMEPDMTFNPDSSVSIARAIKRFLKIPHQTQSIYTPDEFITKLISH